jgi:hypothetical protein
MWPSVSEPASPHSGASGIAPMPAPSRTIKRIRLKEFGFAMMNQQEDFPFLICHRKVRAELDRSPKQLSSLII